MCLHERHSNKHVMIHFGANLEQQNITQMHLALPIIS